MASNPKFTQASLDFLNLAHRQKKPEWLDKNREKYLDLLANPMKELVATLAKNLKSEAPGYHFPTRNFARLKRIDRSVGESIFRDYVHTSISRKSESLYESLPNLYFHFSDGDIYTAGGHFSPSADQTKHIRSWIATDSSALEGLLEDADFKKRYKALGTERMLKTKPRDYPIDHPKIELLKLSGWYVWRPITKKIALSNSLADVISEDWSQVLRLNRVLDRYTSSWPTGQAEATSIAQLPEGKPNQKWDF